MAARPVAVAFDAIETLFSLEPLRPRLQELGLKPEALETWFSRMLRDAFALAAADTYRPFQEVAAAALEVLLHDKGLEAAPSAIQRALEGFSTLTAHPDVEPAFERLHGQGLQIATLTNGSEKTTSGLLKRAGLDRYVSRLLSVDDVKQWKPRREPYLYAAREMQVEPARLALVAAHAWDVHGAHQAGLITGWVKRQETRFSPAMAEPDVAGDTLIEVVDRLLALK